MNWLHALAAAFLSCVAVAPARAEADEWALSIGPVYRGLVEPFDTADGESTIFRSAVGGLVRLRYGVDDFFQIGGSLDAGVGLPNDISPVAPIAAAFFEAHYVVDIVTWVPYATLGIGGILRGAAPDDEGTELHLEPALTLGGGLEYRPAREFAVDFAGRYELVFLHPSLESLSGFSFALTYTLFFE